MGMVVYECWFKVSIETLRIKRLRVIGWQYGMFLSLVKQKLWNAPEVKQVVLSEIIILGKPNCGKSNNGLDIVIGDSILTVKSG